MLEFHWSAEVWREYTDSLLKVLKELDAYMSHAKQLRISEGFHVKLGFVPNLVPDNGITSKPRERRYVRRKDLYIDYRPNISSKEWEIADGDEHREILLRHFMGILELVDKLPIPEETLEEITKFVSGAELSESG